MMEGILVMDKPAGFTSFDVVAKLRGICETRKIGHGGTLDPMATGVLPVFVGRAVKAVDLQPQQDKTYQAGILLGVKTDTGDVTGEIIEQHDAVIDFETAAAVLPRFLGQQSQLPPMYSAVKVNGKPLYKYARQGVEVKRKPREVTVYSLDLIDKGPPPLSIQGAEVRLSRIEVQAHCSKGTYIRTLAEEIGNALGVPATLDALRRTQAGVFGLEQAVGFEQVQQAKQQGRLQELFQPVQRLFAAFPLLRLNREQASRLCNGAALFNLNQQPGQYQIYLGETFLGLGLLDGTGVLRVKKMFGTV